MNYNSSTKFGNTPMPKHRLRTYRLLYDTQDVGYSNIHDTQLNYSSSKFNFSGSQSIKSGAKVPVNDLDIPNLDLLNFNTFVEHGDASVPSGTLGCYGPQKVILRKTKVKPITNFFDTNYCKLYGIPVNKVEKLTGLTGFTLCDNFHLEGVAFQKCTTDELDMITAMLKGGIIL